MCSNLSEIAAIRMQDKKALRLAFPVVALAFCAAAAVVWLHHGAASRVERVELVGSDCGTLCQARNLILNTKNALDNKAEAELMLLRSGQGSKMRVEAALVVKNPSHGKARKEELALLPSTGPAIAFTDNEQNQQSPGSGADHKSGMEKTLASTDDSPSAAALTKVDLNAFVEQTLEKERNVVMGAPGVPSSALKADGKGSSQTGLARHPTWYDGHNGWYAGGFGGGHWHNNEWCRDNPRWHGPFGDTCVAYATGGDRQFWCEWDGAGANNACPRSCGSCSWRTYNKDEQQRALKEHLLHEHFDPQEPPDAQEQPEMKSGASKMLTRGPEEPKRIAERRSMTGALLKDVTEMKDRLMEVAKATRAVATEVALSRTSDHRLSSGQASADLANFFKKEQTPAQKKAGVSDSDALSDLLNFFDQEPGGEAEGKGSKLAALRAKVRSLGAKGTGETDVVGGGAGGKVGDAGSSFLDASTPQIVADLTVEEKKRMAEKAAAAKRAAVAHRLSSDAANKDIASYWAKFVAKAKVAGKKKLKGHGMTAAAASRDLNSFLAKMVAKARVAHRATELAANARRAKANSGREAVPAKQLSDKQARKEFESWWGRDMASPLSEDKGGHKSAGKEEGTGGKAAEEAAKATSRSSKSKGLATFSAAAAANALESFWDEEFPTRKKAPARPFEHEHQHERQHEQQDRWSAASLRAQRNRRQEEREDGGGERALHRHLGSAGYADDVSSLGLPQGREEAVRISHAHRTSSASSRGDLDAYFGKALRRDNIAVAKQRLKQAREDPQPAVPATAPAPQAPAAYTAEPYLAPQNPQTPQNYPQYAQPPQYGVYRQQLGGGGAPLAAAPYAAPYAAAAPYGDPQAQGVYMPQQQQEGPAVQQLPPAQWPQNSMLDPMQAAFGAAYDGFLAAVDAEAKAGEGRMAGGMSQSQAPVVAPQVGTVLGEMSRGSQQDSLPSGVGPASRWAYAASAAVSGLEGRRAKLPSTDSVLVGHVKDDASEIAAAAGAAAGATGATRQRS